jgi:hypothetical protein
MQPSEESGYEIVTFQPSKDDEWSHKLTQIHLNEAMLLDECMPKEMVVGETDDGKPIIENVESSYGPENDVVDKVERLSSIFSDLKLAYAECPELSFRLPMNAINFFSDAASIDYYFLPAVNMFGISTKISDRYQCRGIVLLYDGIYYGHVWYFTSLEFPGLAGIYGMKTSLVNLMSRLACDSGNEHRKGIAKRIMLNGVYPLAKSMGIERLVVPWPLEPMIPILNSLGFTSISTTEYTRERKFFKDIAPASEYFVIGL